MTKRQASLAVNFAVFLFGMAGLFAKWVDMPAVGITFGRVFFSSIALFIVCTVTKKDKKAKSRKELGLLILGGIILAIHWTTFLGSVQISTVAIGTVTFSTFPLFVTFLEPIFFEEKLKKSSIVVALVIIVGVIITIPEFSLENNMVKGIIVGMISSFTYSVLALLNRNFTEKYESSVISLYEQATAAIVLLPVVFLIPMNFSVKNISLLVFMGIVTTALGHTLFIGSLKPLSARLAGVITSLESVYGILLALVILREVPSTREILGAVIIVGAVIASQLIPDKEESEV